MTALAATGARLFGGVLRRAEPLAGGDLSQILRVELADGRTAIVKSGPAPETEAAMLQAIAAAGVPAPRVLAANADALVIEELPSGGSLRSAWGSLGAVLARLHETLGTRYGWPVDYAFGPVAIENAFADEWPRFWGERRLAANALHIPGPLARRVERLAADLANRLPARPEPSLLHGDLWGGNVLVDGDHVSGLIDPACYFGHCEVDLAMLTLFDRPNAAFYDAYGALEPGAEERLVIYRLWPALVHLRLFGSGYRGMVESMLTAAGV
jgi:fructosamine-3-kinase